MNALDYGIKFPYYGVVHPSDKSFISQLEKCKYQIMYNKQIRKDTDEYVSEIEERERILNTLIKKYGERPCPDRYILVDVVDINKYNNPIFIANHKASVMLCYSEHQGYFFYDVDFNKKYDEIDGVFRQRDESIFTDYGCIIPINLDSDYECRGSVNVHHKL